MKKISTIILSIMISPIVWGQTNTFPSTGKVGIGTTSPLIKLQVEGSSTGSILNLLQVRNQDGAVSGGSSMTFKTGGFVTAGVGAQRTNSGTTGDGDLIFYTLDGGTFSEQARILDNGNVGIGTTNPSNALHVVGDFWLEDGPSSTTAKMYIGHSGAYIRRTGAEMAIQSYNRKLKFKTNATNPDIEFHTADVNRMTIDGSGNVGIGTASPKSLLDIGSGIGGNVNYNDITIGNGSTNTGIQIFSGSTSHSGISFHNADVTSTSRASYDGGIYYNHNDDEFQIWASKARRLTINSLGNVGIGTASPEVKLDISGAVSARGETNPSSGSAIVMGWSNSGGFARIRSRDWGAAQWKRLDFQAAEYTFREGNVAIGTTTPATGYKLSVAGKIISEEVNIQLQSNWPDYVFAKDYKLRSLAETADFIKEEGHLPNIPSAQEVAENGILVGEMNAKLLEKIEELTLHLIEQNNRLESQQKRIAELENKAAK